MYTRLVHFWVCPVLLDFPMLLLSIFLSLRSSLSKEPAPLHHSLWDWSGSSWSGCMSQDCPTLSPLALCLLVPFLSEVLAYHAALWGYVLAEAFRTELETFAKSVITRNRTHVQFSISVLTALLSWGLRSESAPMTWILVFFFFLCGYHLSHEASLWTLPTFLFKLPLNCAMRLLD